MEIKAKFVQLTAKQGKSVLQFELDEACGWALPDLATLAGGQVMVTITDPQRRIDVDAATEVPADAGPLPLASGLPEAVGVAGDVGQAVPDAEGGTF